MSEEPNKEAADPKPEETQESKAPASQEKPQESAPVKKDPAKPEKVEAKEKTEQKTSAAVAEGEEDKDEEKKSSQPTAAELLGTDLDSLPIRRAKGSKNVTSGVVHILATFNNTKVTFSDKQGNVISWSSAGKMNFRGSRKSTAYAAQVVTQDAGRVAMSHGMREVDVHVKGPGLGRDSAVRALQSLGFTVNSIIDVTPVPHNGCRSPKRRRV